MALSQNTIIKLSEAISDDVAQFITEDERFFELLTELIPEAVYAKLGSVDDTVVAEMSMNISGLLRLISV